MSLKSVWKAYINTGAAFSVPVVVSFLYAEIATMWHLGWGVFSGSGIAALSLLAAQTGMLSVLRVLFWLPSLVLWLFGGGTESFWQWLAPGFFVEFGSKQ